MNRVWSFFLLIAILLANHNANVVSALTTTTTTTTPKPFKKVVVIGGGWAGFSAADALSVVTDSKDQPVFEIEVLDASPRGPGGLAAGWRTAKLNKPVEAGLHGFWREYKNTFATIQRIGLELDEVLTPYTPSMLVSDSGKVALAPVLGYGNKETKTIGEKKKKKEPSNNNNNSNNNKLDPISRVTKQLSEVLPPPLDLALLSEFEAGNPLSPLDRLSGIGALGVWADFEQESPDSWRRYDSISAENLFKSVAGVTPTLYNELVSPLLHVLPMTPGYDCSAAAALSCLHVFALQTKGAFDVRWCKGSITEKIFNPWSAQLLERGNVEIRGGARVTSIVEDFNEKSGKSFFTLTLNDNSDETIEADSIVFAIGGTSLKNLVPACPPLAKLPESKGWEKFRGVTCVAVRLFFDQLPPSLQEAMSESPVVVCGAKIGKIPELVEAGFCIYDVERLQDSEEVASTVEVDFFRANPLVGKTNEEVVEITLEAIGAALAIPRIDPSLVADSSVVRAKDAVSHFCVGSAGWSPNVKISEGLYICGDWIDRTGHASWSTEKSVVTGIQAAAALAHDCGANCPIDVIPAASDTEQLRALRRVAKSVRGAIPSPLNEALKPQAPWTVARQFFS